MGLKKELSTRFVLPVVSGTFLLIPFGFLGYYLAKLFKQDPTIITPLFALVCYIYFLLHEFSSKKPWTFPSGKMKERPGSIYNNDISQTTTILLTSDNGKIGTFYYLKGWNEQTLKQIAFHYTFGEGKLSHRYLRSKFKFSRGNAEKFQFDLVDEKLAEFKNPKVPRMGIRMKSKGVEVFYYLAKKYIPSPTEKKDIAKYCRKFNLRITRSTDTA